MSLRIAQIIVATGAAVLLLACGGDDPNPETQPSETAGAASGKRAQVVERKTADRKSMQLRGIDADGVEFEASIGLNARIPEGFPTDVPIIPGAETMAALSAGSGGVVVTLKSSENQSTIREFYLSELPKNGWTLKPEKSFGGQIMIEANQGTRRVSVTIAGTSGDSRLSIILSEEP